jgi:cysteine desulfurase family protein
MSNTIYFDNAATSHPKPETVYQAADSFSRSGGSAGRAAHKLALSRSREVFETRLALAEFLGISSPERLIFTSGCTQSINIALHACQLRAGQTVLVSSLEHNAVMRPLYEKQRQTGMKVVPLKYRPGEIFALEELENKLSALRPALCVFMEASNVTGEMLDLTAVSQLCARFEVPLLVDAAQSAGLSSVDLGATPLSFWCASGHKGLMGVQGAGLLYVGEATGDVDPLIYGGTGSHSEDFQMPLVFPDRLEPGTMPGPAIFSLAAGIAHLTAEEHGAVRAREQALCRQLADWLAERSSFKVYGSAGKVRAPLLSFELDGVDSSLVAELLDREYDICVRAGLHCAAAAHKTLGTLKRGLVRVSFGSFNTSDELRQLFAALDDICSKHPKASA